MVKKFIILISLYGASLSAQVDYNAYTNLLENNVSSQGRVNYKALKQKKEELRAIVGRLNNDFPANGSKNEKLAYWINVYNANTLLLITEHYPIKSIMDLDNGTPWDVKRIRIGKNIYSLNQIEHEVIRKEFKEPRIHFVLNCAATSCPPLLNQAYNADNIEAQMDRQTKLFLAGTIKFVSNNQVEVSKLFEWYADDFGNLISFLNKNSDQKFPSNASFVYSTYDWKLNE